MEDDDFISKTRRKRQMKDLQDVGADLVKLSPEVLARLDLPEQLRDAVEACRTVTKHEARRRQIQYIGRIMRDIDAGPIAEQLARLEAPTKRHTALFHLAEKWRKELMEDADTVARFVKEFPGTDPNKLRSLIESAHAELDGDRPPKKYRELFHVVNAIVQDQAKDNP
jgi:ribosome-associated protein